MNSSRRLVLDANILLRGVFGVRVRELLERYEETVDFYTPDACLVDAGGYVQEISLRRNLDPAAGLAVLRGLMRMIQVIDASLYEEQHGAATARIGARDEEDWPVVAAALLLDAPIWTEDRDFFGAGIATWTTRNVELYLRNL